jgi:Ulp1 family protease
MDIINFEPTTSRRNPIEFEDESLNVLVECDEQINLNKKSFEPQINLKNSSSVLREKILSSKQLASQDLSTVKKVASQLTSVSINYNAKIIINKFSIDITLNDLNSLNHNSMLNDNIINYYMQLLCEQHAETFYCFPSFYFIKYEKDGIDSLSVWIKKLGKLKQKIFFIPVCYLKHWRLLTFDISTNLIKYYDSYHINCSKAKKFGLDLSLLLVKLNSIDKMTNNWKYISNKICHIKQLNNSNDCGVFLLSYVRCISHNIEFNFNSNSATDFRLKIVNEIKNNCLDLEYKFINT